MPVENEVEPKKLTRKRKRNCGNWKRNVSKVKRQSGKAYKNCKGELQPARIVKVEGCSNPAKCPFNCTTKISQVGRQAIFDSFWALPDSEKRHFYVANVKKVPCKRKRTKAVHSRKPYNFNYYFNFMQEDVSVCQQFFNNTLNVSEGRVYYYFSKNKDKPTITPSAPRHGKHPKKTLSNEQKQEIRDHINKFPVVESHYCRHNTNKNYLYQGLNLATMYRLYVEESDNPAKISAYRNIFNFEFNLSFFRPKKDRCDKCMAFELLTVPTEDESNGHNNHVIRKKNAAAERKKDREIPQTIHDERKSAIVDFDMENVFQLPITNASIAYYCRKFSLLSFTAVINKTVYNAMWNESLCGREGTHIANALIKVLNRITQDHPFLEYLTLWSDSCVPQNRNSLISAAIQRFLDSSVSRLEQIDQKFSEAGHSQVQPVDNAHSVIEKSLRHKFIYSPPALVEEIRKIPEGKLKFVVIEMEEVDYLDYQLLAHAYNYTVVPYTKVKQITYKKHQSKLWIKYDFPQDPIEKFITLKPSKSADIEGPLNLELLSKLSSHKIDDIRSMFGIMPDSDKLFYESIFAKALIVDTGMTNDVRTLKQPNRKRKSSLPSDLDSNPTKIKKPDLQNKSKSKNHFVNSNLKQLSQKTSVDNPIVAESITPKQHRNIGSRSFLAFDGLSSTTQLNVRTRPNILSRQITRTSNFKNDPKGNNNILYLRNHLNEPSIFQLVTAFQEPVINIRHTDKNDFEDSKRTSVRKRKSPAFLSDFKL